MIVVSLPPIHSSFFIGKMIVGYMKYWPPGLTSLSPRQKLRFSFTSASGGACARVTVPEGSLSIIFTRFLLCFTGVPISNFVLSLALYIPGYSPMTSSLQGSSSFGVGVLGGGVSIRSSSVCVWWSRLLGFDGESLKLSVGTVACWGGVWLAVLLLNCRTWS